MGKKRERGSASGTELHEKALSLGKATQGNNAVFRQCKGERKIAANTTAVMMTSSTKCKTLRLLHLLGPWYNHTTTEQAVCSTSCTMLQGCCTTPCGVDPVQNIPLPNPQYH